MLLVRLAIISCACSRTSGGCPLSCHMHGTRTAASASSDKNELRAMSIDDDILNDLKDVFGSLYDEEDWLSFNDDEGGIHLQTPRERTPEPHPDLNDVVPSEDELRASVNAVLAEEDSAKEARDEGRFSAKRLREAVDSLLGLSPRNAVAGPSKRRKVETASTPAVLVVSPYHPQALLARLRTFKPASYTTKPACLSEVEAARCGWVNDGVEGLRCARGCGSWWTVGRIREKETKLANKLSKMLIEAHKPGCPWRVRQTPVSQLGHLRQSIHPPLSTTLEPIARSIDNACQASKTTLNVTCPLNPAQLENLQRNLNCHAPGSTAVSSSACIAALFGWSPSPLDSQVLECKLCQRRVGLWNRSKPFDIVQEHLAWCPIGGRGVESGTEWWASAVVLSSRSAGGGGGGSKKGLGSLGVSKATYLPRKVVASPAEISLAVAAALAKQ